MTNKPDLIPGSFSVDDRGHLTFFNDFDLEFEPARRIYLTSNYRSNFIRAWHAHKKESKYVTVIQGSALVCAVRVINWRKPRKDVPVHRFVLSAHQPSILAIPAGYANGWMSLTADAKLLWLSTATLDESRNDDVRYSSRYWNPWEVAER
jgi:dTDP-4-dehydrorhamnose 3,5-epimerase